MAQAFNQHESFMLRAIELASGGGREVAPNPLVGAVFVVDGRIVSEGYHQTFGGPHAEVVALRDELAPSLLARGTLYVTLEPCSHHGKTPPCTDLLLRKGVRRVVIGTLDPFPEVAGSGVARLREAGVEVTTDVLREKCVWMNKRFLLTHQLKRPYFILKWAQTVDGFMARLDGSSKWITSEESRRVVHSMRAEEMGILVGRVTAVIDNPALTVRHVSGVNPIRVVLDPTAMVPKSSITFNDESDTICFNYLKNERVGRTEWIRLDRERDFLSQVIGVLYSKLITSVIVEGGAATLRHFLDRELWDEAIVFEGHARFETGIRAPIITTAPYQVTQIGKDTMKRHLHPQLVERLNLSGIPT